MSAVERKRRQRAKPGFREAERVEKRTQARSLVLDEQEANRQAWTPCGISFEDFCGRLTLENGEPFELIRSSV